LLQKWVGILIFKKTRLERRKRKLLERQDLAPVSTGGLPNKLLIKPPMPVGRF